MPEQEQAEGVDPVRAALVGYATACGEALARTGAPPRAEAAVVVVGDHTVRISVVPTPRRQRYPGLSPVEHQVLDVLEPAQWALSAESIQRLLERRGGLHGLITIRRALARLKGLGLVDIDGKVVGAPNGVLYNGTSEYIGTSEYL